MNRKIALILCVSLVISFLAACNKPDTSIDKVDNGATSETTSDIEEKPKETTEASTTENESEKSTTEETTMESLTEPTTGTDAETSTETPTVAPTPAKTVDGDEIAKVLLAIEGLKPNNIEISNLLWTSNARGLSSSNLSSKLNVSAFHRSKCMVNGNRYEWSDFSSRCYVLNQIKDKLIGVESDIDNYVGIIDWIKQNGFYTDEWVTSDEFNGLKYLLTVEDGSETLYMDSVYGDVQRGIFKRYTDEQARSVYEIYLRMKWDDNDIRTSYIKYIPDVLYEYAYDATDVFSSNGNHYKEYHVMEKVDGYWNLTIIDNNGTAQKVITNSDANYRIMLDVTDSEYSVDYTVDIFSPDGKVDLLTINVTEDIEQVSTTVPLSGYSGYSAVGVTTDSVSVQDDNNYTMVETDGDKYLLSGNGELLLNNGTVLYSEGNLNLNGVDIYEGKGDYIENLQYNGCNVYVSDDGGYWSSFDLFFDNDDFSTAVQRMNGFMAQYGLNCKYDLNKIIEKLKPGQLSKATFKKWNVAGYTMENMDNLTKAIDTKCQNITNMENLLNSKSGSEWINLTEMLMYNANEYSFTTPVINSSEAIYDATGYELGNIKLTVNDTTLFNKGSKYSIRVGYARGSGSVYDPCSYLAFDIGTPNGVEYTGGNSFTISQDIPFVSHQHSLYQGDYMLVAWVVNEDNIRVTNFVPILFEVGQRVTCSYGGTTYDLVPLLPGDGIHVQAEFK